MDLRPLAFQGEAAVSFLGAGCVDPPAALFFLCLYVHLGLIFYGLAAGILAWCDFGLSQGLSLASRGPFVYAQGAWIRLRHFFLYECIYIWGFAFVRRLRGCVPAAFCLLPGDALRPLGVVVVVIFLHRLQRSVSANT